MDDIEQIEETAPKQPAKRSGGLTVLCILSIMNAVINILAGLLMFVAVPVLTEMDENGQLEEIMEQTYESMEDTAMYDQMMESFDQAMDLITGMNANYYLFMALLYGASLAGVILMWKLRRNGLSIYGVAQGLLLINSAFFVYANSMGNPLSDIIFAILFVALYSIEFKKLEKLEKQQ